MQPLVAAGVGVVAVATVAGAGLARWRPGQPELWFGAAAGALLVIAGLHLLPDAWSAARAARLWPCTVSWKHRAGAEYVAYCHGGLGGARAGPEAWQSGRCWAHDPRGG